MKHRPAPYLRLFVGLVLTAFASPTLAAIDAEVNAVAADKLLAKASLGVQVIRLGSGPADMAEVYGRAAHVPLVPASNLKLVTTAAALDKLGPDFKFRTALVLRGRDLVLIGDGDPSFGDPDAIPKQPQRITAAYEQWAAKLKELGVSAVDDVFVDDAVFDEVFVHPDWPENQMDARYQAQVGGLSLNTNLVDLLVTPTSVGSRADVAAGPGASYLQVGSTVVTGSENAVSVSRQAGTNRVTMKGQTPSRGGAKVWATVHDPPLFAGTVLVETLTRSGIKVNGQVKRDRAAHKPAAGDVAVGEHLTPLPVVLGRANKDSVNLYAESLCKRIGYDPAHGPGSWENGTAAVGAFLKTTGVPESDYSLADGSGLSKKNAISPRAIVRVLCYEFYGPNRDTYLKSLSVAGVDGTLEDRFFRTDLQRRVFGKSGFVEGVSTLSGYLQSKTGEWYAFSVMVNGIPRLSNSQVKKLQERIVTAVDAEVAAK